MTKHKIAIIGSGPAGLAAAIYTSRAEIETTIYAGEEPGGQLTKTAEIENYPGVMGKTGPELMLDMTTQAQKFGATIEYVTVTRIVRREDGKILLSTNEGKNIEYDAVILAMGASPKLLGVGEDKYWGRGFSTCAVCDAAFYKGKNVYVVGGGDAAIEDAWALTKFASSVTMLVRGDQFRASKIMQKRVLDNPDKIKVRWKTQLRGIEGERVEKLILDVDGEKKIVEAEGLFFAIGHVPATEFLKENSGMLDENGYLLVGNDGWPTMTATTGVFGAGDCSDHRYRQAATAVGMGVSAALDCERWLESNL
jgi:thioredoxin reductase (NADPH)